MTRPRFSPKAPRTPGVLLPVGDASTRPGGPPALVRRRAVVAPVPVAPSWPVRVRPQRGRQPSTTGLIALGLVLVGLFAVAAGLGQASGLRWPDFSGPDKPPPRAFPVLEPSRPMRLLIPSIGVAAPVLNVGLAADGAAVDVPPLARHNEVGWFERGPTPGQFGPAVFVGHADTHSGPSVFVNLGKLKPGQRIEVVRRDRRIAVFEVNSVERFGKADLPVDRVLGDYRRPTLRLITCGGRWLGGEQGYADNVIVFASLVASRKA